MGEVAGRVDEPIVGEVYVLDRARLPEYVRSAQLHLAHDFSMIREGWAADGFRRIVSGHESVAPRDTFSAWLLNNHDHPRAVSRFDTDGAGRQRARLAAFMLFTLRCTPFLFQGEELGLADTPIPADKVVDVDAQLRSGGEPATRHDSRRTLVSANTHRGLGEFGSALRLCTYEGVVLAARRDRFRRRTRGSA